MRLFRNILIILLVLAFFGAGLGFVASNGSPVTLDLLVPGWQFSAPLGWLLLLILLAGLFLGLLLGIGLKGVLGLARRGAGQ